MHLPPNVVGDMDLHDVVAAAEGHRRTQEGALTRTLLVVNTVRGALGADPITLESLVPKPPLDHDALTRRMEAMNWEWSPDLQAQA